MNDLTISQAMKQSSMKQKVNMKEHSSNQVIMHNFHIKMAIKTKTNQKEKTEKDK